MPTPKQHLTRHPAVCTVLSAGNPGSQCSPMGFLSTLVFEDETSLAFLDTCPLFPGHRQLVPKAHVKTLADLPAALVAPLFQNAQRIERAIENSLRAEGIFVAINNRVSQSVPHLHIHLVPRHQRDGLKGFFWPRESYEDQETMLCVQTILRSALMDG